MSKLKLYLARKWLRLLPTQELETELMRRSVDKAYKGIADKMLKLHFSDEVQYMADLHTPEGRELYRKDLQG